MSEQRNDVRVKRVQGKPEQRKSGQGKSEQRKFGQRKSGQEKSGQEKSEQRKFGQGKSEQGKSEQRKFEQGKSGQEKAVSERQAGNKTGEKPCPVMGKCGGCQYLHLSYQEQLKRKDAYARELCAPFVKLQPIIGMEEPKFYRNKVHAAFGEDRRHNIISGQYEEQSHRIVPVDSCLLENQKADAIIVTIRSLLKSFKIRPYNEDTGYGLLRHVLIRCGHASGQIMVVLVLASPVMPSKNNFVKALLKEHPEITTVVVNVNNRGDSMVLGDKEQVLYGKGYIEDTLCGKVFRISPRSFYQVNPVQTEKLYGKAIEFAGLTGRERVLDAYCGTGTIGMIAADHAKQVIGVELNADAVRDARMNAKRNEVKNIEFFQQDAGKFMVQLAEQGEKIDVVIMDPPRAGSDEAFLSSLARLKPEKVVYVSCNPETLARDLKYLVQKGYQVKQGVSVDMFPWSRHVETVCLLSKLHEAKHHVSVKLDMDELDLTVAESKATYEEIKDWVQDKYGFHITNLNIAQVKQKYGITDRVNYNKPKSENSRQPGCPEEKVKAIEDAMRHFRMI